MQDYNKYLKIAGNVHLAYYIHAAEELGIHYEILTRSLLARFEYKGKHWFIINTATPLTNTTGTTIVKRKSLTNMVLDRANIPVPIQEGLNSAVDAIKFFNRHENVVIKPAQQLGGKGITLLPENEDQVIKAYNLALETTHAKGGPKVLGEEFLQGENYRFLVVGEKVVGMIRRKSPRIHGDGEHTIKELIDITNENKKKELLKPITLDDELHLRLRNLDLNMDSVPQKDEEIILKYTCNLTAGGTTQECSNEVHEYYKELAVKAIKAVDAEFGGVDIIAEDITKPSKCGINEINYNPGLRIHYKVDEGDVVPVAIPIMEYIRDKYIN